MNFRKLLSPPLLFLLLFATLTLSSCGKNELPRENLAGTGGGPSQDGTPHNPNNNNNNINPVVTCGNGVVDSTEVCDKGIVAGNEGACPDVTQCQLKGANQCVKYKLEGDAESCTARCTSLEAITACNHSDGCCPTGCDASNDNDCAASCGDGIKNGAEKCDYKAPASSPDACPTTDQCAALGAGICTKYKLEGGGCDVACVAQPPISTCTDSDGCCPAGCDSSNDNDCGTTKIDATIGVACTDNSPCGAQGYCISAQNDGSYPGGYCSADCAGGKQCPDGSMCSLVQLQGANAYRCLNTCSDTMPCRAGYECDALQKVCVTKQSECVKDQDCKGAGRQECRDGDGDSLKECVSVSGAGNKGVGVFCDSSSECVTGASCLQLPNSSHKVCTFACDATNTCPQGTHCAAAEDSGTDYCLKKCTQSSECGGGLECKETAPSSGVSVCKGVPAPPPPPKNSKFGEACSQNADCVDAGNTCYLYDKVNARGVCTVDCTTDHTLCPTNALCEGITHTSKVCLAECTSDISVCSLPGLSCQKRAGNSSQKVCYHAGRLDATVGGGCLQDTDCGPQGKCLKEQSDHTYKAGYCSGDCSRNVCPSDSSCIIYNKGTIHEKRECRLDCDPDKANSCRDGYFCHKGLKVCTSVPAGVVICTSDSDCTAPQECADPYKRGYKECFRLKGAPIGGACANADGCLAPHSLCDVVDSYNNVSVCTLDCKQHSCPDGSICVTNSKTKESRCRIDCSSDSNACQVTPHFECTTLGSTTYKACLYKKPTAKANVGGACTDDTACGTDGVCMKQSDFNYTDGICSADCRKFVCPTGSSCRTVTVGSTDYYRCFKSCSSNDDCSDRTGYTCQGSICRP